MQLHKDGYYFKTESVFGFENLVDKINDRIHGEGWELFQILSDFERNEFILLWTVPTTSVSSVKTLG
jgi:hypothetical protein